jgi:predicted PurR-regulated permease PerM
MADGGGESTKWRMPLNLLVAGFLVYLLRDVLVPFAVAFILAYVFSPVVDRLGRYLRLPRLMAVLLLFLLLAVPVTLIALYQGPLLAQNVGHLAEDVPGQVTGFVANLIGGQQVSFLGQTFEARVIAQYMIDRMQEFLGAPLGMAQVAWSFINVIMGAIFTMVICFYFLTGGKDLIHGAYHLAPLDQQESLHNFTHKVDSLIGRFLRGLAIIVIFTSAVVWIAFRFVFDLPYAGLFAIIIGSLEVIPLFGPIVSGALTGVIALVHGNLMFVGKVLAFYMVVRFTNDQLVGPIVLGKAVTLSPVIVLFAFLTGSTIFGFLGLLFAVPVAAVFKVVLDERRAEESASNEAQ